MIGLSAAFVGCDQQNEESPASPIEQAADQAKAVTDEAAAGGGGDADTAQLEKSTDELKSSIETQQSTIDSLKEKLGGTAAGLLGEQLATAETQLGDLKKQLSAIVATLKDKGGDASKYTSVLEG